jgi:hypothetical protein
MKAFTIEDLRRAEDEAEDAMSRQSWQWTGAGPHPQEVISAIRDALEQNKAGT